MLTGDLLQLHVGGRHLPREEIAAASRCAVAWSRGKWGLFKALSGIGAVGRLKVPGSGTWQLTRATA